MNILILCSGLLAILYAALSVNVSVTRLRKRKDSSVTEAQLTKAIRAHGNASEYIPLFIASFLFLGISGSGPTLAVVAVLATVSRVAHAAGMFRIASVNERHPLRYFGALGTYVCLFAVAIAILLRAF
ncbi:MAG: MAPEG family protein [Usitatibacter sp.]